MSSVDTTRQTMPSLSDRVIGKGGPSRRRLLRFSIVGTSGVVVNSGILAVLVQICHLHPTLASAIATETAILSNFSFNDRWTFREFRSHLSWSNRALRYNLAAMGGLLFTVTVLGVLTNVFHVYYLVANLFATGGGFLCNYALSSRFAWATTSDGTTTVAGAPHSLIHQ